MTTLRVLGVSFLNARPLVAPLRTDAPKAADGTPLLDVGEALPSACAIALAEGRCDVALVPVATLLDHPEWEVVPYCRDRVSGAVQTVVVAADARSLLERICLDVRRAVALCCACCSARACTGARDVPHAKSCESAARPARS